MSIQFSDDGLIVHISNKFISYVMEAVDGKYLVLRYFGKAVRRYHGAGEPFYYKRGYTTEHPCSIPNVSFDDFPFEYPARGYGDYRIPAFAVTQDSGIEFVKLMFQGFRVLEEKPELTGLPAAFAKKGETETLEVTCEDGIAGIRVRLYYTIFEDRGVIARSQKVENIGNQALKLQNVQSFSLELPAKEYDVLSLYGTHAGEGNVSRSLLSHGVWRIESVRGSSSPQQQPFFALMDPHSTEYSGEVYGFQLIYSGNFLAQAEKDQFGNVRAQIGIHPDTFCWELNPGEAFQAPEAILNYSSEGLNGMSQNFHWLYQYHLMPSGFTHRERPVLLNSWEAMYYDVSLGKLEEQAEQAKELGAELFVLDDGWFGRRDNDRRSLGDWDITDRRKLPEGLGGLAKRVRALGIGFGLWVEPEMVSEDSRLYRAHPDWILGRPGQAVGRNQFILDLSREEVQDHLVRVLSEVFEEAEPAYVKWDMNRVMTDTYSAALPPERQGEVRHRYILGLYRVLGELTARFPKILFEACASGGNRTDPGMLCYMPQVWLSDNTDALCRCRMQYNASFGYPQSVMGAHVSASPNHQTLRTAPLDSRFQTAAFGLLGYELDLCSLPEREKVMVAGQIAFYKKYRGTLQFGRLYRLRGGEDGLWQIMAVSGDYGTALSLLLQQENRPNAPGLRLLARGLASGNVYRLSVRPVGTELAAFGSLVNMVSPVRVRPGSLMAAAEKLVRLPGEKEGAAASGDLLMKTGIWLKQGFSGAGFDGETRVMGDFGSRLYVLEAEKG